MQKKMQEKIILAPGVKKQELLKSLALKGNRFINLKIMGAGELARTALMKSGVAISEDFVSSNEEYSFIAKAVADVKYFGRTTYADIKQIAAAVKQMRCLVKSGDEDAVLKETLEKGTFEEKNEALYSVYKNYIALLEENKALDNVSLMRRAIKEAKVIDADFCIMEEYPLNPLEKLLIEKVSGGQVTKITIKDLYKDKASEEKIKLDSIKNCYGAANEVETIIEDIYKGKKLDTCTVAVTSAAAYSQLFFDYAVLYDIPVNFGCGIPIINSNPAKLLMLYYRWLTEGFFSKDALWEIISSKFFNRSVWKEQFRDLPNFEDFSWNNFYEILGGLRLTNDEQVNKDRIQGFKKAIAEEENIVSKTEEKEYEKFLLKKNCIPYLEIAARELALLTEDFISKYAYIRNGSKTSTEKLLMKIDRAAVGAIYDELGVIRKAGIKQSTDDLIKNVLSIGICGESREEGKLYITDISGALSSVRENLYIAGLSATKYPGPASENYLLLDEDIKHFGSDAEYFTSKGKIKKKRERLFNLVKLASALGNSIKISYAGLNVSELKKENASSYIFELFREEVGHNVTSKDLENKVEKVVYFEPAISKTREIGKAYNEDKKITSASSDSPNDIKVFENEKELKTQRDRKWSPTAIGKFLEDPACFMRIYMLGIPEPEEINPMDVINPMAKGILIHSLMERLANSDMDKEMFLKISEESFNRYVNENPPLISKNVEIAKEDFMDIMNNAYDMDPHRVVVLKEEDIECEHPSGVKLRGFPDRVEKLDDGSYLIVDYKSGRSIKHEQDDINSCFQVVAYAYLMEQKGFKVSSGEFRYLRFGKTVTCKYDDEMKESLNYILEKFKKAIDNFNFSTVDDESQNKDSKSEEA